MTNPGTYAHFETNHGNFTIRLMPEKAPKTVANFVGLAEGTIDPQTGKPGSSKPYYDGLTFHRIIEGFMIQGGDPTGTGRGGPAYRFEDEFHPTDRFDKPGILAMANAGPNTNGSQFFITEVPTPWLDPKPCTSATSGVCGYVHFGEGVCGCDLVAQIARAGNGQTKLEKVTITDQAPTCK